MIKPTYLTRKPGPPMTPKRLFDQQVIPVLIDFAACLETAVEQWAMRVRKSPGRSLGAALGGGALLALLVARRRP